MARPVCCYRGKIKRGGYILYDCEQTPDAILIATGSEVHLSLESALQATAEGLHVRVVSMPCAERFLAQDAAYQEHVLPNAIRARIAIEAAASAYWYRFVGLDGIVIGVDQFGLSAPAEDIYQTFGITVTHVVAALHALLHKKFGEVV